MLSVRRPDAQSRDSGLAGKLLPPHDQMKIHLTNVMVNRIEPFGSAYGHFENVTVSFSEFRREYRVPGAEGVSGGIASVQYALHLSR